MEKISFTKMSGAGNDFIVIDKIVNPSFYPSETIIKKLCDRRNGIGADGLITIDVSHVADFNMMYYNADGSTGSLCGNGARCTMFFAYRNGKISDRKTNFISNNVLYKGEILGDELVRFYLNPPGEKILNQTLTLKEKQLKYNFIDTGSPHVIIDIDDMQEEAITGFDSINDVPTVELGREIRYHHNFTPAGTNVNFIKKLDDRLLIRTYERGVENETLACGTGSVAAAVSAYFNLNMKPPVTLKTRGGDELIVDFDIEEQNIKNLSLTGPAKIIYTGQFLLQKFI